MGRKHRATRQANHTVHRRHRRESIAPSGDPAVILAVRSAARLVDLVVPCCRWMTIETAGQELL